MLVSISEGKKGKVEARVYSRLVGSLLAVLTGSASFVASRAATLGLDLRFVGAPDHALAE